MKLKVMSLFQRPDETYIIDFSKLDIQTFLIDEANPLGQIVQLIPDGSKVLDIGAGNGLLGWLLSNLHRSTIIDGVEPASPGAQTAAQFYRNFYNAYFQDVKEKIIQQNYDYIVLADVIEHIQDPYSFLKDLTDGLSSRTKIILSIPNIAHGSIRLSLLYGNFDYEDSGLIERTHLRFFTLKTIQLLVKKLNLSLSAIYYLQRKFHNEAIGKMSGLKFVNLFFLLREREALTYQYLIVLSKEETQTVKKYFGYKSKIIEKCFKRKKHDT